MGPLCPECEEPVEVESPVFTGALVICDYCGQELEITSVSPLVLELAPLDQDDFGE
jgi:alpha-aminoadipate/glutamate carrier protein LysW